MIRRQQRIEWIAAVGKEYLAAKSAANLLQVQLNADPNYGTGHGWQARDGAAFDTNLEPTYIVRLFAEFETGVRDYWANHLNRDTHPPMFQLLQSLADQRFSIDLLDNVHAVREYRNSLVHGEPQALSHDQGVFTIAQVKRHLCSFFGRLDANW